MCAQRIDTGDSGVTTELLKLFASLEVVQSRQLEEEFFIQPRVEAVQDRLRKLNEKVRVQASAFGSITF